MSITHTLPHCLISVLVDKACVFTYPTQKANAVYFQIFYFCGKVYLGLVVKFTIMTSLGSNPLNCKIVRIKTISIYISGCHKKQVIEWM